MLNVFIGQRVRELRKERGLTQAELADRAGLSDKRVISQMELGNHTPSAFSIEKLARALGVEAGDLFPKDLARSQQEREQRVLVAKLIAQMREVLAELVPPEEVHPSRAEYIAKLVDNIFVDGMALHGRWDPHSLGYDKVPGLKDYDAALTDWLNYALELLKEAREKEARAEDPNRSRVAGLTLIIDSLERRVA